MTTFTAAHVAARAVAAASGVSFWAEDDGAGTFRVVDATRPAEGGPFAAHRVSAEVAAAMVTWLTGRRDGTITVTFPEYCRSLR